MFYSKPEVLELGDAAALTQAAKARHGLGESAIPATSASSYDVDE